MGLESFHQRSDTWLLLEDCILGDIHFGETLSDHPVWKSFFFKFTGRNFFLGIKKRSAQNRTPRGIALDGRPPIRYNIF